MKKRKKSQLKRINSLITLEVESKRKCLKKEKKKIQPKLKNKRKKSSHLLLPISLVKNVPTKRDPTIPTIEAEVATTEELLAETIEEETIEAEKTMAIVEEEVANTAVIVEATGNLAEAEEVSIKIELREVKDQIIKSKEEKLLRKPATPSG